MRNYVSRFRLPNGKWAYIQITDLADRAKQHVSRVQDHWKPPPYFFHLQQGGHIQALKLHQKNVWYGKLDLKNFFYSVSRNRIVRCLKSIGYSFHEAENFAVVSTICVEYSSRRFALPFGFVQSPILASLALDKSELGRTFRCIDSRRLTLSVYVDDIIISSNSYEMVQQALGELRVAANKSCFAINEAKSGGPSDRMRAFNIDVSATEMKISKDRFEAMCQEVLHHEAGQVSNGILAYVQSVSDFQADQMVNWFPRSYPNVEV